MPFPVSSGHREGVYDPFPDPYYEDSRKLYKQVKKQKKKTGRGEDVSAKSLIGPKKIRQRCRDLHWLQNNGFSEWFTAQVMMHDNPEIRVVKSLWYNKARCPAYIELLLEDFMK